MSSISMYRPYLYLARIDTDYQVVLGILITSNETTSVSRSGRQLTITVSTIGMGSHPNQVLKRHELSFAHDSSWSGTDPLEITVVRNSSNEPQDYVWALLGNADEINDFSTGEVVPLLLVSNYDTDPLTGAPYLVIHPNEDLALDSEDTGLDGEDNIISVIELSESTGDEVDLDTLDINAMDFEDPGEGTYSAVELDKGGKKRKVIIHHQPPPPGP